MRGLLVRYLLDLGVEDSLGEDLLRDLGSHVRISTLRRNENTADLALLSIDLVNLHLDTSGANVEGLVVLLEHSGITLLSGLKSRKSNGHVISGGSSTSLGVKEKTGTVGRNAEVSAHLESGLEGSAVTLGNELLHGEEERNTLSSRKLNGGGGVVNTLLLLEDDVAALRKERSLDTLKSVSLPGHDLGVDELLLRLSGLADLLLNGPSLGLNAHLRESGARLGGDGVLSDDLRAAVGKSSSLNLEVGKLVELGLGDGLSGEGGTEESSSGKSGGSNLGHIVLHGIELGGVLWGQKRYVATEKRET